MMTLAQFFATHTRPDAIVIPRDFAGTNNQRRRGSAPNARSERSTSGGAVTPVRSRRRSRNDDGSSRKN